MVAGVRAVRAVRGATTVTADEPSLVRTATRELLAAIVERNGIAADDLISAFFTVTADLTSEFPAIAARELGWTDVPLLCALEIPVRDALPRCIRVLLHVASDRPRSAIAHVYLGPAEVLRPDLAPDRAAVAAR
jgi:chorismate mutase